MQAALRSRAEALKSGRVYYATSDDGDIMCEAAQYIDSLERGEKSLQRTVSSYRDRANIAESLASDLRAKGDQCGRDLKRVTDERDAARAAANEIDGYTAQEWRNRYFNAASRNEDEVAAIIQVATSRALGVPMVDHVASLEAFKAERTTKEAINYAETASNVDFDVLRAFARHINRVCDTRQPPIPASDKDSWDSPHRS